MKDDAISDKKHNELFHSCGVWPKASYINHCCYSNAHRSFIGDMMIVRATQDLAPDTEITFWYQIPHFEGYSDRQKKFRMWGFQCDCSMCQDDKKTDETIAAKRKNLRAKPEKYLYSRKNLDTVKLEKIFASMANTYTQSAIEVPRLAIWDIFFAITRISVSQKQPTKAIEFALRCLGSLGYVIEGGNKAPLVIRRWGLMQDQLVECWVLICVSYRALGQPSCETQAYAYAKISYRICMGEDETFDEAFGKLVGLNSAAW